MRPARTRALGGRRRGAVRARAQGQRGRSPDGCIIRRAGTGDVSSVAELCGAAFHPDAADDDDGGLREGAERMLARFQRERLSAAVEKALRAALRRKNKANGTRIRARRGWARFSAPGDVRVSRAADDDAEYMRESRCFQCLVCCEADTDEVVGAAFVFLYRAKADTPPPLPTNAPFQMYLSNLAVDRRWRGRRIADRIMDEAERLARLMGYDELLLHVQPKNAVAYRMYTRRGYRELGIRRWWNGDQLLRKGLTPVGPPFLAPDGDGARPVGELEAELARLEEVRSELTRGAAGEPGVVNE